QDLIGVPTERGDENDVVSCFQLVQSVERVAVHSTVSGDRHVTWLARKRRVTVVTGPCRKRGRIRPLDDHRVEPDAWDLEAREGRALLDLSGLVGGRRRRRLGP